MISFKILWIFPLVQFFLVVPSNSTQLPKGKRFRIIEGRRADIHEFPYQVSIERDYNQWCGGAIISRRVILTAAHCVDAMKTRTNLPVSRMLVRVGTSQSQSRGKVYAIKKFIVHEDYGMNVRTDEADIAMIILKKRLKYREKVRPIDLVLEEPLPGDMAWVTGYGRQDPMRRAGRTRHLMAVEIPIMDREKCKEIHGRFGNLVTDNMICAGYDSGSKDSCKGDSGGPLVVDNELAGIVAWGMGCGRDGMPGVYTSIAKYLYWIEDNLHAMALDDKER